LIEPCINIDFLGTLYWKDMNKNWKLVIFSFCEQNVCLLPSRLFSWIRKLNGCCLKKLDSFLLLPFFYPTFL
jgi:hypothetical protein